ncbi:MAG: DUF481 domain-containing protein [Flavobacteriaceae bacterium]
MKYIKTTLVYFFLGLICAQAQVIIDTESSLKKIDSTFHLFANFMTDRKKGNFDFSYLRGDVTIGSRKNNNLYRLTFSHTSKKFNGNLFDKSNNLQLRWNHFLNKNHSLFVFAQTGNNRRSFIDERTLLGVGLRFHLYQKSKNYFDIAFGPFYEYEAYPAYSYEEIDYAISTNETTRISLNLFGSVKLFENITSLTTLYTQWKYDEIGNFRIFGNQYLRFKINDKVSTFVRYVIHYRSINYVQILKNDTDFMYGIEINI